MPIPPNSILNVIKGDRFTRERVHGSLLVSAHGSSSELENNFADKMLGEGEGLGESAWQ
jgi:hypothetical protein